MSTTNSNPYGIYEGQEVFCVLARNQKVTTRVTKVGRVFFDIAGQYGGTEKVRLDTLVIKGDGRFSKGQCYPSEKAFEEEQLLKKEWSALRSKYFDQNIVPKNLTLEKIQMIKELLS